MTARGCITIALMAFALTACNEACPENFSRADDGTCVSVDARIRLGRPKDGSCAPGQSDHNIRKCRCKAGERVDDGRLLYVGLPCGSCALERVEKWCRVGVAVRAESVHDGKLAYMRRDFQEALQIFRPLAEGGEATAQVELAQMYFYGEGVPRDTAQALHWYRKGANQSLPVAFVILGQIYSEGSGGVTLDKVQAYKWFSLAIDRGSESAHGFRRDLAREMTPAQVAEGERLARAWRPE